MFDFVNYAPEYECEYFPVSYDDISSVEKKFGIEFPSVLKEFYLKHNGRYIHMTYIDVDDAECDGEDSYISVDAILPLVGRNPHPYYSVEAITEEQIQEGWIPDNFIPFAITQGGAYFHWKVDDGKVYIIYDEGTGVDGGWTKYLICSSVEEMFKRMNEAYEKEINGEIN